MANLTMVLGLALQMQDRFGTTENELPALVEGFSIFLCDYPMSEIIPAIFHYIRTPEKTKIPKVCEIKEIIDSMRKNPQEIFHKRKDHNQEFIDEWEQIIKIMNKQIGDSTTKSWISPLYFEGIDGHVADISAPTKFIRNWVLTNYYDKLLDAVRQKFPKILKLDIRLCREGERS